MSALPEIEVKPLPPKQHKKGDQLAYGSKGLLFKGIARESAEEIRKLVLPDLCTNQSAVDFLRQSAQKKMTRDWLLAQLRLYGIECKPTATKPQLRSLLRESLEQGLLNSPREDIQQLEQGLADKYAAANEAHVAKQRQRIEKAFAAAESPSKQASISSALFLRRYFVDAEGNPDQSKTAAPMVLKDLADRWRLKQAADKIPGLKTASPYSRYYDELLCTLVIGWEDEAVWSMQSKVVKAATAERDRKKEQVRAAKMKQHTEFAEKMENKADGFDLSNAVGLYHVRYEEVEDQWPDDADDLSLSVESFQDGLLANFEFGIVEGMMILATEKQSLGDISNRLDNKWITLSSAGGRKRKASTSARPAAAQKIKLEGTVAPRYRLWFNWRGMETGEGEPVNNESEEGEVDDEYIDFLDEACTRFEGQIAVPFMGKITPFVGYKLSNKPKKRDRSWPDYDGIQYYY